MALTLESVANAIPINWTLIRNPANWLIVFLMVAVAGAAIALLYSATGANEDMSNG